MLFYAKYLYIFQSLDLVDIPWSVPMSGRTNMVSTYHFYRFEYSTPSFGTCTLSDTLSTLYHI